MKKEKSQGKSILMVLQDDALKDYEQILIKGGDEEGLEPEPRLSTIGDDAQ